MAKNRCFALYGVLIIIIAIVWTQIVRAEPPSPTATLAPWNFRACVPNVTIVATAQTPIENRIRICDGRTVTPFPKPTWTPDPITAAIDKPLPVCYIGIISAPWACIENSTIWECAQMGLVNGDGRIKGSDCPVCMNDCRPCAGISYLPLIIKMRR